MSITGGSPNTAVGLGLVVISGCTSVIVGLSGTEGVCSLNVVCLGVFITGGFPKKDVTFGLGVVIVGVVVVGVVGVGVVVCVVGLVCSGGGSLVRILYRKCVPFLHWASISVEAGPV